MISLQRCLTLLAASVLTVAAHAATFEDGGVVEKIALDVNQITVDGEIYSLPNRVVESNSPNAGPAIFQLRPGMYVVFSGETGQINRIDSLAIHLQAPQDYIPPKVTPE